MSFLPSMFGPSKEEIWRQFCAVTGGNYTPGGFWSGSSRVDATHGPWTVTLDTYVVSTGETSLVYTRMRAPYLNPDGFSFNIHRGGIFSALGRFLGMQDVEVGYPDFDRDFVIKGNDVAKLRRLFSNPRIRKLVAAQPHINFSVKDDEGFFKARFPQGVDELYFEVVGVIKDVERLRLLYELFSETLDELCRLGSAREAAPGIKL